MKYVCSVCGFVYDEEKEGKPFAQLEKCPLCQQPADRFRPLEEEASASVPDGAHEGLSAPDLKEQAKQFPAASANAHADADAQTQDLSYDPAFVRQDASAAKGEFFPRVPFQVQSFSIPQKAYAMSRNPQSLFPADPDEAESRY